MAATSGLGTASLSALHSSWAPSCCLATVSPSSLRPVPVRSGSSLELARPGTCCPFMYQDTWEVGCQEAGGRRQYVTCGIGLPPPDSQTSRMSVPSLNGPTCKQKRCSADSFRLILILILIVREPVLEV